MTTEKTTRDHAITRYSLIAFFVLALLLGGGTIVLVIQGIVPSSLALASALSASIAGIVMTGVEEGKDGLRLLWRRLRIWRVGAGYWLFALFFLVPAFLLGSLANPLFGGDPLSFSQMQPALMILPLFISFILVAGVGQELGWTGYLLPRLQARYNALTACFIRAIYSGIWHLPLLYYASQGHPALADFPYGGWIAGKGFLVAYAAMNFMFLLPWSIFFTWIFNNTWGSLLLVAVLHGSEFWAAYWMMSGGIDPHNLDNYWGYGAVMVLAAAVIVMTSGPQHLSRKNQRIIHQPSPG